MKRVIIYFYILISILFENTDSLAQNYVPILLDKYNCKEMVFSDLSNPNQNIKTTFVFCKGRRTLELIFNKGVLNRVNYELKQDTIQLKIYSLANIETLKNRILYLTDTEIEEQIVINGFANITVLVYTESKSIVFSLESGGLRMGSYSSYFEENSSLLVEQRDGYWFYWSNLWLLTKIELWNKGVLAW